MRPCTCMASESSLERAAATLRGMRLIPIQRDGKLAGVITDHSLADALARGCSAFDTVECALTQHYGSIGPRETGAEALRRIAEGEFSSLLVVDANDRVLGILVASDLYPHTVPSVRPPLVGGMATPFGVYLTNGAFGAGVPWWALASTGAMLFLLSAIGALLQAPLSLLAKKHGMPGDPDVYMQVLPLATLFIGMRLLPLAGIHAAEHKVVHAIERGEPLVPEVVGRMSRIHPRCGTNLMAGALVFSTIISIPLNISVFDRAALAVVATVLLWRRLGTALQWLFTTRPPNRKQIEMGIRSGEELLEKYRRIRNPTPTFWQRIWNSGLAYVLVGFTACELLAQGLAWIFHWDLPF